MFVFRIAAHMQNQHSTPNRGSRDSRGNAPENAITIRVRIVMRYQKQCDSRVKGGGRGKGYSRGKGESKCSGNNKGEGDSQCIE